VGRSHSRPKGTGQSVNNMYPTSWRQRLVSALVLLLAMALGARVAAELLAPLVPALVVLVLLMGVLWIVIGKRR
jgi:hypothetical protein